MGDRVPHRWFYAGVRTTLAVMLYTLCRLEVHGRRHVPGCGPFILASNHTSYLDPPILATVTRRPLSFMATEELFDVSVLGPVIRWLNAFPVRRDGADRAALRQGLRVLREGRGLAMFPEGMRSPDGRLLQPRLGIGLLALHSGAPVVPVGIVGAGDVWPVSKLCADGVTLTPARRRRTGLAKVRASIGEPLTFADLCDKRPLRPDDLAHVARCTIEAIARLLGQRFEWQPDQEWWEPYVNDPAFRVHDERQGATE